ncbi:cytochrome c/FTR1 family iron permease [Microbulbifer sp. OS29]|uniref:Cytochrome c/FTR1 family iron permease n=1 Tax=Microbulbifer okhotskensis TaxID=2926617 RepID=A0A9X2EJ85_9GAMM|nr:cytochrome c/FTR1 family iron permease [Microbulbifer okhotskensis]MCO1333247.1 cytochrome c/FTR1 family iron permease [Microbulbifer okhotskensis]
MRSTLHLARLLLALLTITVLPVQAQAPGLSEQELRQLMQMAEYIGVDYPEAVAEGAIINEDEFEEMQEFAEVLIDRGAKLQESAEAQMIRAEAQALQAAILRKGGIDEVQAHTAKLRQGLLAIAPALSLPTALLSVEESRVLYQAQCITCHGVEGKGDGPLAAQLEPAPTNFHELERAENRSVLGLYDAISNGIDGTAMTAFQNLNEQQRWSLAFYVGSLAFQGGAGQVGGAKPSLQDVVMYSPNVLHNDRPELSGETIATLRADPSAFFVSERNMGSEPIEMARAQLEKSLVAYQAGDYTYARTLAISAYLDGFELAESSLDSLDANLRKTTERELLGLRSQLNADSNPEQVVAQVQVIQEQLGRAESLMQDANLSAGTLFLASLLILLREGLEALLVVIALTTILIKTGRRDALKFVHLGWVSAAVAGVATWVAAQSLISISGASREVMEGVAALLAAVVLFYVGFWMHSKTQADQWQQYILNSINRSLSTGALWGVAGLAFIAVYREIFETILFYQALLVQTASNQYSALWGGLAAGAVLLAIVGVAFVRYSARLPIGKFFYMTTYVLLALSFVLAGKAIAALQEAAWIAINPLPVNLSFDWLGIYSTWQGVGVQGAILVVALWLLLKGNRSDSSPAKAA